MNNLINQTLLHPPCRHCEEQSDAAFPYIKRYGICPIVTIDFTKENAVSLKVSNEFSDSSIL